MSRTLFPWSLAAALLAWTAQAEVPRVAADIAPVHSLVSRVMEGVGEPSLIVASGASPHEYNLRPSQAASLQEADLVFWVSPDLTPWLADAIGTLAGGAAVTELLETDGTTELAFREGALFDAHDRGEEHGGEDGTLHGDRAHGAHDPHAWLSPDNGAAWLDIIAAALSAADPDNAGTYASNAAAGRDELAALRAEIEGLLDPVRGRSFVVFHDAYQYFEAAFGFPASGAISLSDAADPSPSRISEIRARIAEAGVTCVLSEPQFDPGLVAAVTEGSDVRTGVLDPLGSDLEPGPALYPQVLRNLATTLAGCL